ncbi:MAG: L,D-transpeptidase family protein [Nanoarchaeota archaeon]
MVGLKRKLLNKAKINLVSLGLIGFLSNGFFSCQNSSSQQNSNQTSNLEDTIINSLKNKDTLLKRQDKKQDFVLHLYPNDENSRKKLENFNYQIDSIIKEELNIDPRYNFSYKELQKFNSWIDYTLKESKEKNKISIIINKSDYTLYLIEKGKIYSKYPIELGGNPFDDKQKEGDSRTPEGLYKVSKKLNEGQTAFYKGLLINYPNKEDRKADKTGSLIEIHGEGSGLEGNNGGSNWTLGCVALSNKDIDKIFPYLDGNTNIVIVRYTTKLDSLVNDYLKERISRRYK